MVQDQRSAAEAAQGTEAVPVRPDRDTEPTGVVFDIRHQSLSDGPGQRSVIGLKGCTLRCLWCHNPEAQQMRPEVLLDERYCDDCGQCVPACEWGRYEMVLGRQQTRTDVRCQGCLECAVTCPNNAIGVVGQVLTVREVVEALRPHSRYLSAARGGVTLSGGEPLFQSEYTFALLEALREHGWHTALDTCGYVPARLMEAALRRCDLVLFDLKETDPELHRVWTGGRLAPILDNLRLAAQSGVELWVRLPVVPLTNDRDEHWQTAAELVSSLPGRPRVCVVPYDPAAEKKRKQLGMEPGLLEGVGPPDAERLTQITAILQAHGLTVQA
ncbi:MAG: glycyl-radical enzyme activating protein [Armatimonadetes bacterium]|nr:glycyl-radical enzyme activating protein [Armatimonadota bacterium]